MDRKKRIMAAAAIGAIVILIVSTAVRCAVSRTADQATGTAQEDAAVQVQEADGGEASTDAQAVTPGTTTEDEGALSTLESRAWKAESGATVTFKDGMYIETDGSLAKITAFTVDSEVASGSQTTLMLELYRDGSADAVASAVVIRKDADSSYTVASDQFQLATSYKEVQEARTSFAVAGTNDAYLALVGGDEEGLEKALADYTAAHVPSATKATFDGEVYIDYGAGTVLATFTCDDAAQTILSVTYASGAFTVTG